MRRAVGVFVAFAAGTAVGVAGMVVAVITAAGKADRR